MSEVILEPFHDNIFVEREEPEEHKTAAGIVLSTSAQKKPDTAIVIAVGPGRVLNDGNIVKPSVKPGDKILIGRHSGTDVNWGIERRTVVPWGDVLGIVKEKKTKKVVDKS